MSEPLRVVELKVNSFMGIEAAEMKVDPSGGLVLIGGKNGAGKSSLLSAIECAIRGKRFHPDRPIKTGAKGAEVVLNLGDLVIRRSFTADGGGSLSVENKEGMRPRRPQEMLDALADSISFDPLAFSVMPDKDQLDMVRKLAGIDTSKIDAEHRTAFEARTDTNRDVKRLEAQADSMPYHDDAPAEPVSVAGLMDELKRRQSVNRAHVEIRSAADIATSIRVDAALRVQTAEAALESATAISDQARAKLGQAQSDEDTQRAAAGVVVDLDCDEVHAQISGAEIQNSKHRENEQRATVIKSRDEVRATSEESTRTLTALAIERNRLIASTEMPIDGLEIGEAGLEFCGTPFAQASSAERLRTSIAMGMALNPRLSVMLVRDGEKLDDDGLALLAEMAADKGYQVWVERVGDKDSGAIIIKEGRITEAPAVAKRG